MSAEKTDHKAEALRQLEGADNERCIPDGDLLLVSQCHSEALVHSNLAIAEGQERVAEELELLREGLDGLVTGGTSKRLKVTDA